MRRLLIRPGAIGDFILSLPALEALCETETEVWAASQNVPLVRFARARSIPSTGLDLLGIPEVEPPKGLIETLRGFDSIVSWYGANRPDFQVAVQHLDLPFVFFPALPPALSQVHASDFYLACVTDLASRRPPAIPRLPCGNVKQDWIAVHPFSGSPKKNWPLERYLGLTGALAAWSSVRWILQPGEPGPPGVEVEPPTGNLFELACRLSTARLYIGNDSGITHLAAASGTPVLALFGPTDPAVWAPRGPNTVHVLRSSAPDRDMKAISLDDVLNLALQLLHPDSSVRAEH